MSNEKRIGIASDHAGFEGPPPLYKPTIMDYLRKKGYEVVDYGTYGPDSVDYPDYAGRLCQAILNGEVARGILICGTGIGMSISANRFHGIRAAVCTNEEMAKLSRTHNDANVLCLGRRISSIEDCLRILDVWLNTPYSNEERHQRRLRKVDELGKTVC